MYGARVLVFVAVLVGLANSFSWDIVVGGEKRLVFFHNGTATHTEDIPSANYITAVTYDPVHFRVLFVGYDNNNKKWTICSFDLTTRTLKALVMRQLNLYDYLYLAYDPLTQLLFWTEDYKIKSLSLKPASSNEAFDGNLLVTLEYYCTAIAVDSCGGYIYWATGDKIERAAFDGSKREVLINSNYVYRRRSLAIDLQTEKLYWTDAPTNNQNSVESADLNGKNRRTFYLKRTEDFASSLTVSKGFIYWRSYDQNAILQLPKNQEHGVTPVVYSQSSRSWYWCQLIAANYTIEEQNLGNKSCEALKSLTLDVEERNGSICHNYCFQGNCSVSAEGHPKCSCEAGYSGERCEVNACHMYCLHGGVCSLNEEEEPVCQCTADYEGERCDAASHTSVCDNMIQQMSDLRSEVKQYREELQCTLQLNLDTLNENAAKIRKCEESKKNDLQNHDDTTTKTQTSNDVKL